MCSCFLFALAIFNLVVVGLVDLPVRMKAASLEMQRAARGRLARRHYQQMLSAIFVQARWRCFASKRAFARQRNASIVLQVRPMGCNS